MSSDLLILAERLACRPDQVADALTAVLVEAEESSGRLRNLLAVIHRDGGHHTEAVGLDQSVEDAMRYVPTLFSFPPEPDDLATQLGTQARELGRTIATAESLTGGLLASRITSVSGSSAYFLGGIVAYTLEAKAEQLGVDGQHAAEVNCVSPQVAREMAVGVRRMFGSNIGIATTGYAEPAPGIDIPVAYFALDADGWFQGGTVYGEGLDRVGMQERVVQTVLRHLTGPPWEN